MIYIILSLYIIYSILCAGPADLKVHIWPQPRSITTGETTVYVDVKQFRFTSSKQHKDIDNAIDRYTKLIFDHPVGEMEYPKETIIGCTIEIEDLEAELQLGHDESYTLVIPIDNSKCSIKSKTLYGFYHALETLSQIIEYNHEEQSYFCMAGPYNIIDEPEFKHRGVLLDTARHYQPVSVIKKFIDSLTFTKYNVFHWHITDDESAPIESKAYPKFFEGAYTQHERYNTEDVIDIIEYARQRGVRVVPEFDVPGHAKSWCAGVPEICPSLDCKTPLDPSVDATYTFLTDFLGEFTGKKARSGLFFDDFFHLGGDEVDTSCWGKVDHVKQWLTKMGFSEHDAYLYIVNQTQHIVMDQGRDPINWEEVWTNFRTKLDKRTIIHIWINHNNVADVVKNDYRVIVSNSDVWYIDHEGTKWDKFYTNDLYMGVPDDKKHLVLGGETCMWEERVDASALFNTVWPRAAAAAERMWSKPADLNDLDSAKIRLKWYRCLLNRRGIAAHPVNSNARSAPSGPGGCFDNE